jgi:hypothetical protein
MAEFDGIVLQMRKRPPGVGSGPLEVQRHVLEQSAMSGRDGREPGDGGEHVFRAVDEDAEVGVEVEGFDGFGADGLAGLE